MMDTTTCARVAAYLSGAIMAMEPGAYAAAINALAPRLGLAHDAAIPAAPILPADAAPPRPLAALAALGDAEMVEVGGGMTSYALSPSGIAVLPISGTLSARYDWMASLCGLTSYEALNAALAALGADDRVRAVLLDINSPGGQAATMLDTADKIRALDARKPVWAHANSMAASAAYALAAGSRRFSLPRLGLAGSIGMVTMHINRAAADAAQGLQYTALYSGARKVQGWGHAPLSAADRADIQTQLDAAREEFARSVASMRGLPLDAVLATEGAVYQDAAALDAGLADAVEPIDATLAALAASLTTPTRTPAKENTPMARRQTGGAAAIGAPATPVTATAPGALLAAGKPATPDPEDENNEDGTPGNTQENPEEEEEEEEGDTSARAARIAELCAAGGQGHLAANLIRSGASVRDVKARLAETASIDGLVKRARASGLAVPSSLGATLIRQGATVAEASAAILSAAIAGQAPPVRSATAQVTAPVAPAAPVIDPAAIYGAMNNKLGH